MKSNFEIERKFLVKPELLPTLPKGESISQAYLGFQPVVRIRIIGDSGLLTVKGEGLISREEIEFEVSLEQAKVLLRMRKPETVVIKKTRYSLDVAGKEWVVDFFDSPFDGFVMAEVELESEDEALPLPPWVSTEVTMDSAFHNSNMSKAGRPPLVGGVRAIAAKEERDEA